MIPAFRTAIWSLGSGCILIAAVGFSSDALRHEPLVAEIDATATDSELGNPVEIARDHFVADMAPTNPPSIQFEKSAEAAADVSSSTARSPIFQNASLNSGMRVSGLPGTRNMPLVTIKPDERPVSPPNQPTPPEQRVRADARDKPEHLVTRIYRPMTITVTDLERLIRPLLTPGIGTAVSNRGAFPVEDSDDTTVDALLVRDRQQVLSQIDAVYADLEAAPKRIVIDAVLADVALPDSVGPGWQLRESEFGVVKAEPHTVVDSLRSLGSVTVIATNQLQIVDRQWGQLEWTERATPPSPGLESTPRLATKIRIRPSVLANGGIRLEVHPTSSRLKEAGRPNPQLATVAFTTDVALRSGATAIIAGSGDERIANAEPTFSAAKIVPNIHPQPSIRHETILLLMPRILRED
jgi:type II/III secretion system protein